MEIDNTKVMLFLNHSVHVVTRYLTKNSCVLLQTEATDLTWIWSRRLVELYAESGWENLQVIGLCVVLGRIV